MNNSITFLKIKSLLQEHNLLETTNITEDAFISSITYDSRNCSPGTLFICKGVNFKEEYFFQAKTKGISCYISEIIYDDSIPFFHVKNVKKAMSIIAIAFYNNPSCNFKLTGITGTAGKTTTAYMIQSITSKAIGRETGLISTNETYCGKEHVEAENTTPESLKLQSLFHEAAENGLPFVTMEVSSQAYSVDRVYNQPFDVGIFMNIDKDHIGGPEHPSYEHYRDCKMQLIKNSRTICIYARTKELDTIIQTAKESTCHIILFDVLYESNIDENINATNTPDINQIQEQIGRQIDFCYIDEIKPQTTGGYSFTFHNADNTSFSLSCNITGYFNLVNSAASICAAKALGIDDKYIISGLKNVFVPGRMNIFNKDNAVIIVDYAHNRLTLLEFLKSCKTDYPDYALHVVIGAAGKNHLRRDDIADLCGRFADFIYLTNEDPDFEDPQEICEDIASRLPNEACPYEIIIDRPEAITKAIKNALSNNQPTIIAILGKGTERFIKLKGKHEPCQSDADVVIDLLK